MTEELPDGYEITFCDGLRDYEIPRSIVTRIVKDGACVYRFETTCDENSFDDTRASAEKQAKAWIDGQQSK